MFNDQRVVDVPAELSQIEVMEVTTCLIVHDLEPALGAFVGRNGEVCDVVSF